MAAPRQGSGIPLTDLLDGLGACGEVPRIEVTGLSAASGSVQPGDLFLACRGIHSHGLEHVAEALQRGAGAVVWERDGAESAIVASLPVPSVALPGLGHKLGIIAARFYGHPSRELHVIGVTGTDGKTSVSHFIAQALSQPQRPCGVLGTLGYGVWGELHPPTHTTPDALRLQAEMAALRDRGVEQMVMEVSSHALHQHRTDGVVFDTAVLTHLSRDHLDYHGSVEAYAEAKRRLFASPSLAAAVVNVGDAFGRELAASLKGRLRVIAWQGNDDGEARRYPEWLVLRRVRALPEGLELDLLSSQGEASLRTAVLGDFNAGNLLAAVGALLAAGVSMEDALRRLSGIATVAGRMELVSLPGAPRVVIDYAHTPHALESVLRALRPHCRGELVCVFGAGGDRDRGKRPLMGAVAERLAERVILTSDNPRSEDPGEILRQIAAGFEQPARALIIEDRARAIDSALAGAAPDDLVLIAGKGDEAWQEVAGRKLPFSDREQARRVLRRLVA
ncbi:MAG TPA: UDP-N-acetylmuramoyl-L-alanyl-D-glutamate--2,6-diaminopimelate ligase [Gammaproteobacteria bacterium]|nr:UDP-N-acetylmuramoyl-L-alanyl-D-glutamate--2,6-diaminopimelate ligase [Gammaproteobacteria bacterium]